MSDTNTSGKNCSNFRVLFDRIADGDKSIDLAERNLHEAHGSSCTSCQIWKSQTMEVMDMTAVMPKFDVSEALTQRILNSVETEKTKVLSLERLPAAPLGIIAAIAVIMLLPAEGLQGALAWSVGVVGLVLLQVLLKSASATESVG